MITKKKTRAYHYRLKPGCRTARNEAREAAKTKMKYAAIVLAVVAVETLLIIEYLNVCINHIINH